MRIPMTLLVGLAGYFVWVSSLAELTMASR
jgi:hypothetical protein